MCVFKKKSADMALQKWSGKHNAGRRLGSFEWQHYEVTRSSRDFLKNPSAAEEFRNAFKERNIIPGHQKFTLRQVLHELYSGNGEPLTMDLLINPAGSSLQGSSSLQDEGEDKNNDQKIVEDRRKNEVDDERESPFAEDLGLYLETLPSETMRRLDMTTYRTKQSLRHLTHRLMRQTARLHWLYYGFEQNRSSSSSKNAASKNEIFLDKEFTWHRWDPEGVGERLWSNTNKQEDLYSDFEWRWIVGERGEPGRLMMQHGLHKQYRLNGKLWDFEQDSATEHWKSNSYVDFFRSATDLPVSLFEIYLGLRQFLLYIRNIFN